MYLIARQAKFGYKNVMGDIQSKTIAKTIALCNQSYFVVNLKIKLFT